MLSASDITRLTRLKANNMLYKTDVIASKHAMTRNGGVSFCPYGNLSSGDCMIIQKTFGLCNATAPDLIVNGQILDGNDGSNVLILDGGGGSTPVFILDGN